MTLPPRKREQLTAFLGELPNATAVALFAALEADRAKGGKGLPHDALISDLRRQLLDRDAVPPVRKQTAKRLFFAPFEGFFIGRRSGGKHRARIARSSLDPIWRLMMTESALSETALAAAGLDDALRAGRETEALERAMFISAEAGLGRLCARARENRHTRDDLVAELGGNAAFEDMQEIRLLLAGVGHFKKLRDAVPSSAPSLTEEQYYDLRALFLSAYDQSRALGAYLLLALKGRLEKPWRALGVYYHLARSADDRLRSAREAVMALPESLFEDIEAMARALERDCAGRFDADAAVMRIAYFADYADGLMRQAAKVGDNVFMNRVEACRDIAAEAHDRFAEQALSALRKAMPVRHAGGSSRLMPLRPDIAAPVGERVMENACAAAAFLAGAVAAAGRLGADPSFTAAIAEEAAEKTQTYAEDLIAEIRAAEGADREAAKRIFDDILKIAAPLLTRDKTGLLRDRAAAAAVSV